ncbi:hypothetical protein HON52_02105 [Candidatus Uhrbacteria bacterium]|nr:hypothetical protein [Candidatus Uhrbacteria bacterium]
MNQITMRLSKALVLLFGITLVTGIFAFIPSAVLAQSSELAVAGGASGLSTASLPEVIGTLVSVFLSALGIVLLIIIIYAGFLWMTAGGDADKVEKAKKWMINGVVGLVIVMASYAITAFIISALTGALIGGGGGSGSGSGSDSSASIERSSGSLGQGGIRDHFPARNATGAARNINILVTFKSAMDIEGLIDGYDTNGTPDDTSDDTVATTLNTDNILIYRSEDGEEGILTSEEVSVTFTEDLKTFSFSPEDYLGSSTEDTSYTVFISEDVGDKDGDQVVNTGGYEWSFEVGTEIDLTPPYVVSVSPEAGDEYDRNIVVQITFSEAVDPTVSTGTRESGSGFSNIQTHIGDSVPLTGEYAISNGYKTVTYTTDDECGENSCGELIYCLPGLEDITVDVIAATVDEDAAPQAETPYDGIVDVSANALDGDGDGEAGDDYDWSFSTSDDVNLEAPEIESIGPDILEENVELDQEITVLFDSIMMSNTMSSEYIVATPNPSHEMWYVVSTDSIDEYGDEVVSSEQTAVATQAGIRHGVFLASTDDALTGESCAVDGDCESGEACNTDLQCYTDGTSYLYSVDVTEGVRNQYQNCYVPGEGPDDSGGSCGTSDTEPFCCNGEAQSTDCSYFSS